MPTAMRAWYASHLSNSETRMSRMLLGVLSVLWALGMMFGQFADALFALTPGLTLSNYYLWTFVTAGLYENSFFMGLINICVYVAVAPMLERSWGGYSFFKFVGVVNLCVAVTVWLCMVACYAATEFEPCLFRAVCGFSGLNAAFAVALKQKFGERPCVPGVRFLDLVKFKHLPMLLGWVSLALWLGGSLGGKEAPLIFCGTFFAWLYLRFFMTDAATGVVGDLRAEFSSATFFPDVGRLRPLVEFAGTVVFQAFFSCGFFADAVRTNASLPTSSSSGEGGSQHGGHHGAMGGHANSNSSPDAFRSVDPTAERRRLLAIKAIDDKLAELARQPNNSMYPPELSGGGGTTAHAAFAADAQPQSGTAATAQAASSPSQSQSQAQAQAAASSALAAAALPSEEELEKMEAALAKPAQD